MLEAIGNVSGRILVDGTFGGGGYTRALLGAGAAHVLALDRDAEAITRGAELVRTEDRLTLIQGRFGDLREHLAALGRGRVHGLVLDLGVSSFQLDQAARGFSFRQDGPLDMRMDPSRGSSAADVVNYTDEKALADILFRYGEERQSRKIARAIVEHRRHAPIFRTHELAALISRTIGPGDGRIDPATRTFQALRIHVNEELGELERALAAAEDVLLPGGRLVVVAFHSLEDRMVKRFLQARSGGAGVSRHRPQAAGPASAFRLLTRQPIGASEEETTGNPRARSARLRAAERLPLEGEGA